MLHLASPTSELDQRLNLQAERYVILGDPKARLTRTVNAGRITGLCIAQPGPDGIDHQVDLANYPDIPLDDVIQAFANQYSSTFGNLHTVIDEIGPAMADARSQIQALGLPHLAAFIIKSTPRRHATLTLVPEAACDVAADALTPGHLPPHTSRADAAKLAAGLVLPPPATFAELITIQYLP